VGNSELKVPLTDEANSDEAILSYLEKRYPQKIDESPELLIHPSDPSVYDQVRKFQQEQLLEEERGFTSHRKERGFRWSRSRSKKGRNR
jgi:hypothetical protein